MIFQFYLILTFVRHSGNSETAILRLVYIGAQNLPDMSLARAHEASLALALITRYFACTAHQAANPTHSSFPMSSILPWACRSYIFFWLFHNTGELWGKESIFVDIIHPAFLCPVFSVLTLLS